MELSIGSQTAFSLAAGESQALGNISIEPEHIFLGLCKISDILGLDKSIIPDLSESQWNGLKEEVKRFTDLLMSSGLDPKNARRRLRNIIKDSGALERGPFSGHRSPRCRKVFDKASEYCCNEYGSAEPLAVELRHLLLAVLDEASPSIDALNRQLTTNKSRLIQALSNKAGRVNEGGTLIKENEEIPAPLNKPNSTSKTPLLDQFGRDLTRAAKDGVLDPAIGRSTEIKKIAQTLIQKKKNNPVLIGEAGVGKTCIVEGFALKVVMPDAPPQIKNFRIVELSMASLVAGTKYRGEFEEKLEAIIKEASADPDIVLFIDEIHTMVGAGAAGGAMDAGNILKPALARGTIKCIGATTTAEYRKYIEKDPALERRFQVIWVDEPSRDEAVLILQGLRPKFEQHHNVTITDAVIEKAVELSMRYLTDYRLPDKAIDLIDQACARAMLKTFSPVQHQSVQALISVDDIARVVSERCRIPVESLTVDDRARLEKMEDYLQARVIGQEHAVKQIADAIRSAKAGLKDPNRPIVFLFAGSTGTGKTELAKTLAEFLFHDETRLLTFDMSEYQEKHTASKLIGAPPGYIGHDDEGQLTGKVRTHPYSVILFDEIEKAHPDVFDMFLQIFDEGRLTDSHGRRTNFAESVIILTSNLGSSIGRKDGTARRPIGIDIGAQTPGIQETIALDDGANLSREREDSKRWREYEHNIFQAVGSAFRPEFLNRIQKKILFYPLSPTTVKRIISEKILVSLNKRLASRGVSVVLDESALNFLMTKGYDEIYGAREMQRVFEVHITEPLSHLLLKGEMAAGKIIVAKATAEKIFFE